MALTAQDLEQHGYRQLALVLRSIRSGSIGFDLFRNPLTRTKSGLVAFMLQEHTEDQIRKACAAAGVSLTKAELPENAATGGQRTGPGATAGAKGHEGEGKGDGEAGESGQGQGESGSGESGEQGEGDGESGQGEQQNGKQGKQGSQKGKGEQGEDGQQDNQAQGESPSSKPKPGVKVPPPQEGEHRHPIFDKVFRLASKRINVMLVGPSGCGKTHMFGQVMKAIGVNYASISGSAGASESQLLGRLLPTGDGGRFEYHPAPFVNVYEGAADFDGGGGFLFDEIDAFDPNMLVVTNQATANGSFYHEARFAKPRVTRHMQSILMAAANTYGVGAGAMYVGRNQLDAATLDRWYVVEMDYDRAYEKTLAPAEIVQWVWGLRDKVQKAGLRRVVSTRMIQKLAGAMDAGLSFSEVRKDLLAGYTADELKKCGMSA